MPAKNADAVVRRMYPCYHRVAPEENRITSGKTFEDQIATGLHGIPGPGLKISLPNQGFGLSQVPSQPPGLTNAKPTASETPSAGNHCGVKPAEGRYNSIAKILTATITNPEEFTE